MRAALGQKWKGGLGLNRQLDKWPVAEWSVNRKLSISDTPGSAWTHRVYLVKSSQKLVDPILAR